MKVSLYSFVDLYGRALDTAAHLLARGSEHAAAQGIDAEEMLDWRLIGDMQPLRFQLMVVIDFAQQWPARVAGLPVPHGVGAGLDAAGLSAAMADAKAYLATLGPERFEARDDVPIRFRIGEGMEPTLPAGRWLSVFATTNLYFHLSTAYGILRSRGVPIGKVDLFAGGL
ncbi:hypothetical protein CLG96_06455 [Sphingomonas oleivorans]|uniref:DUF1993 domain-containing protein n=1 Tax=Sphingomonas oleivorans TaxID=1735121 RepID=A0A2T5FZR2_9SPHN|nr:DUF1993 domain-containing protein [Sphingomonas oleivorans]PTQ12190.1 hypothetical protein CLG96_06455 [Sphingomonas oleivorans]